MEEKLIYTPEVKHQVKKEIVEIIGRICTGDAGTCLFGYCIFNKICAKPYFEIEKLPNKKQPLKSLLKNVKSKERKKNGVPPPANQKSKQEKRIDTFLEELRFILGQCIYDHELIKGNEYAAQKIHIAVRSSDIQKVNRTLQERHKQVYGREKVFGHRRLYKKYFFENKTNDEYRS